MPLSEAPARCFYCIEDAKEQYTLEHPAEEIADIISEALDLTTDCITSRKCMKCNRRFCSNHSSPVDQSDCCISCLPFEDISEMRTPLVTQDETGTHIRKGYRIVPTGEAYKTLPKAICDMTDLELDTMLTENAQRIHEVEKQKDYLKAKQSVGNLEKGGRQLAAERALRGIKIALPVSIAKGIKITGGAGSAVIGRSKANGAAKGVAFPGLDLGAFLKFAMAKKAAATKSSPSSVNVPMSTAANPAPAVAHNSVAVTAKKEGPTVDPAIVGPSEIITPQEAAREAEIEAILEGGETNEA